MENKEITQNEQIETLTFERNTIHNYKIKLPTKKFETKTEALLNIDNKNYYIGGDVWLCLWFRTGRMGNQISLEYNRFSDEKLVESESHGNSIGKYFVESYFPIDMIPTIRKYLVVFERVIGKRNNNFIVSSEEFDRMVQKEFNKEEKDGDAQQQKQIKDF